MDKSIRQPLLDRMGGFMKGICHPTEDFAQLTAAGIRWVRWDIPYPLAADGSFSTELADYRARCMRFLEHGIRTVAISSYPNQFITRGIDVTTPAGLAQAGDICRKTAEYLDGAVGCWQTTNEMHILQFRAPLNQEQSVDFLIACEKGLKAGTGVPVGHNSWGGEGWIESCRRIEAGTGGSDYIGVDNYSGTWGAGGPESYLPDLENVSKTLNLPVILMEFGFATKGGADYIDHEHDEINNWYRAHGFDGTGDVMRRPDEFIEKVLDKVSPSLAVYARRCAPADKPGFVAGNWEHLLKKWNNKPEIPHTEEGQAEFYRRLLPELLESPYVAGAVIYCHKDSPVCGFCGAPDCPCETAWGLVRCDGTPKPGYETVKNIWKSNR